MKVPDYSKKKMNKEIDETITFIGIFLKNNELEERISKAIDCINYYAIEDEDYSKLYNDEEQELLKILGGFKDKKFKGEDNER